MMEFDPIALDSRLATIESEKQLAFGILLCERMMPGLQRFGSDTGFETSLYRACLDSAWTYLKGRAGSEQYQELSDMCINAAPDTEDFDHLLTSAGLDAALSIGYLMTYLLDCSIVHIVDIAKLATDTVAIFVQKVESTLPLAPSLGTIMAHPLMQAELKRQADDLEFLTALPTTARSETARVVKERLKKSSKLLPLDN